MSKYTVYEKQYIEGIPCLVISPRDIDQETPICFLYHGWGSSKDHMKFLGDILAANGFIVYLPDAPLHGERGTLPYRAPETVDQYFWNVIFQNVDDFDTLANAVYRQNHQTKNKYIIGSSMGGFTASAIFARNQELTGIVNLMGGCAWEKAEEVFRRLEGKPPASFEELAKLKDYDPLEKLKKGPVRPMLLLHGNADPEVPIEIQRFAYQELSPLYQQDLQFIEFPDIGHSITLWMVEEAVRWLTFHVKKSTLD